MAEVELNAGEFETLNVTLLNRSNVANYWQFRAVQMKPLYQSFLLKLQKCE